MRGTEAGPSVARYLVGLALALTPPGGVSGTAASNLAGSADAPAGRIEIFEATGGLPARIAGRFSRPLAFQQASDGDYFVFDRGEHRIYRIDAAMTAASTIVDIGAETGRILGPRAFDLAADGTFAVADSPRGRERIQLFTRNGSPFGGFSSPGVVMPRVVTDGLVLSGFGSLDFTGRSILVSQPARDALITVYGLGGTAYRTIGRLRPTGHENDREVHLGLNSGIPLSIPGGGFYFVFRTGVPMFRRYDQDGTLLFERHIEGPELDSLLQRLPTSWPRATAGRASIPLIPPTIRAAAVAPDGALWVVLAVPYSYVYDRHGEKTRVVQFKATGIMSPTSLAFATDGRILVTPGCYAFDAS